MICPEGLAAGITAAAIAIARDKNADELGLLSAIFVQIGDVLATIAAAQGLCSDNGNNSKEQPPPN